MMSNVELWTYISYGIAALFFIGACIFAGLIYFSSQELKKNPIALPSKKAPVAQEEEDVFDIEENTSLNPVGGLPSRRKNRAMPTMHEPKGKLRSSKSFFDDDDDTFVITNGESK